MAEFWVRHSLNPHKAVKFNITLRYIVEAHERGDYVWVLEIGTTYPDASGSSMPAKYAHLISANNLDEIIQDLVSQLCFKIDWSPFVEDKYAPHFVTTPITGNNVSIASNITFTLADKLPSAGIDLSSVRVFLHNGITTFDITSEVGVEGDPYQYEFLWAPRIRVYNRYD